MDFSIGAVAFPTSRAFQSPIRRGDPGTPGTRQSSRDIEGVRIMLDGTARWKFYRDQDWDRFAFRAVHAPRLPITAPETRA